MAGEPADGKERRSVLGQTGELGLMENMNFGAREG